MIHLLKLGIPYGRGYATHRIYAWSIYDVRFTVCHVCVCVRACVLHKYIHACIAHACSYVHAYAYEMHLGSISRFSLQFVICRRELCINIRSVQIYETGRKKEVSSIVRTLGSFSRDYACVATALYGRYTNGFIYSGEIYTRNICIYI